MIVASVIIFIIIHGLKGHAWQVEKNRKRPRATSSNAQEVKKVFGSNHRQKLKIPLMVDNYNHHMGGVDIADQLRGYNSTQLQARRNWMPLFFWLLDIALVNSFLLAEFKGWKGSQIKFRKKLLL